MPAPPRTLWLPQVPPRAPPAQSHHLCLNCPFLRHHVDTKTRGAFCLRPNVWMPVSPSWMWSSWGPLLSSKCVPTMVLRDRNLVPVLSVPLPPNPQLSLCFQLCSHFTLFLFRGVGLLTSTPSFEFCYTHILLPFLLFSVLLYKWNEEEYENGHSVGKHRGQSFSPHLPLWAAGPGENEPTPLNFNYFPYKITISMSISEG